MSDIQECDFLVIGSGIAGLYSAYLLSDIGNVVIVTKGSLTDSSTSFAQGGIASVIEAEDSFESHIQDTLIAGAGLCDFDAVSTMVTEGPDHIRKLIDLGVNFARDKDGNLELGREGGHSVNRIVHAADFTGQEIELLLEKTVRERNVKILENTSVVDLITRYHLTEGNPGEEKPRCFGAYVYDRSTWNINIIRSRYTILAAGGAGQVYLHNTNPSVSTGDGIAVAYRAGAGICNLEFYQFHPTALYSPGYPTFLITEALRGYGAVLKDQDGKQFMDHYDARKELAPRDIVARAIDAELKKSGTSHVYLDVRHKPERELKIKFPNIYETCRQRGIDITQSMIPVVPAAHYMCGGVKTDLDGQTDLEDLFAVGEVACTGVHGGNRLASNSLLEGLVFPGRIKRFIQEKGMKKDFDKPEIRPWINEGLHLTEEWVLVQHNFDNIRQVMWDYVGIVRSNLRLDRALRRINLLYDEINDFYKRAVIQNKVLELRNLALVARLIILSAISRHESRGLHYNTDYKENRETSRNYTILDRKMEK